MRQTASLLALLAALGAAAAPAPGVAQQVSPDLAARLHDAVAVAEPPTAPAFPGVAQATFSTGELDHLVAPVALYPDALLAQVLVAATYPDQIAQAGQIISRAPGMSDGELSDAISGQQWDQSILVLLSGFPSVVSRMANDMVWTRNLGTAVLNQDPAVLAAVQHMRSEAMAEGNLVSNRAQVVSNGNGSITIRTADPAVVYVPEYDADAIYTTRNVVYGGPAPAAASPGVNPFVAGAIGFGAGILATNLFRDATHHDDHSTPGAPPPPGAPPGPWQGYWHRDDVFDWQQGTFHPHPDSRETPWTPPPGRGPAPVPPQAGTGTPAMPGGEGGRTPPSQATHETGRHPAPVSASEQKTPRPRQVPQEQPADRRPAEHAADDPGAPPGRGGQPHADAHRTADARHPSDARKLPPVCKQHPDAPECR